MAQIKKAIADVESGNTVAFATGKVLVLFSNILQYFLSVIIYLDWLCFYRLTSSAPHDSPCKPFLAAWNGIAM